MIVGAIGGIVLLFTLPNSSALLILVLFAVILRLMRFRRPIPHLFIGAVLGPVVLIALGLNLRSISLSDIFPNPAKLLLATIIGIAIVAIPDSFHMILYEKIKVKMKRKVMKSTQKENKSMSVRRR